MAAWAPDAVEQAFRWMVRVLFRPFSLSKWLVLGFCVFLANLGQGGCRANFPFGERGKLNGGPVFADSFGWVGAHLAPVLLIGAGVLLVIVALVVIVIWLSSRGQFIFLDGVVHDRARVVEPWKRLKRPANSLFKLRLVLAVGGFLLVVLLGAACLALAWPDIRAEQFGIYAVIAVVLGVLLFIAVGLAFALVRALLIDFVVPVMYHKELLALPACGVVWRELIRPHPGAFALFYLLRIALAVGAGLVVFLGTCLTCCIAALPYVSSVVFLPVTVFFRSYPLFFLAGIGPEWDPGMRSSSEGAEHLPDGPPPPPA